MLSLQQRRAQSSQTLLITLMTTQFGGKVLTRTLLQMQLNGKVTPGMARRAKKKVLIPTAVSQLLLLTVLASAPNLRTPTVFRFQQSYSVADVQSLLPLFISLVTGTMVYSLVQSWLLKQLLQLQVQLALFVVPHGYASLLRLQYGRLLAALD